MFLKLVRKQGSKCEKFCSYHHTDSYKLSSGHVLISKNSENVKLCLLEVFSYLIKLNISKTPADLF